MLPILNLSQVIVSKIIVLVTIILYYIVESREDTIISSLKQTLEQNRSWHITSAALLAIMSIPLVYGFFGISWTSFIALGLFALLRMTLFNMLMNLRRNKPVFYLGKYGWDGIFKKYTTLYYIVAILLTILTLITFILC